MEIWKDIPNYEGFYQISNLGRVKSLERKTVGKFIRIVKEKIIILQKNYFRKDCKEFYYYVQLHKDNRIKDFKIHRLVAESFIDNPNNLKEINHKNGIKTDNSIENLEWITHLENVRHAWKNGLIKNKDYVVFQLDLNNNILYKYNSIKEAAEINSLDCAGIRKCILNQRKSCGGFKWIRQITNNMDLIPIVGNVRFNE